MNLGCEVSHADNEGNTAWHAAAQSSNVAVLRKLLKRGCSSESTNNLNCTALHYAARSGVPPSSLPLATAVDSFLACCGKHPSTHRLPALACPEQSSVTALPSATGAVSRRDSQLVLGAHRVQGDGGPAAGARG